MSLENMELHTNIFGKSAVGRPLAIDLFTGLHGWSEGLIAEGFRVVGFDIVDMSEMCSLTKPDHFDLVLQDVLTLHGSQFKDAALIVASPPCQEYSYMAMPWKLAKAKAKAIREDATGESLVKLNRLFNACFRIQAEAILAAGRHIPLVIENVRGAQPWVGRARWNFGSFYLWGDVPALMPMTGARFTSRDCGGEHSVDQETGTKIGGDWFSDPQSTCRKHGSKSRGRKMASAMIAKIPLALSRHVAAAYLPLFAHAHGRAE